MEVASRSTNPKMGREGTKGFRILAWYMEQRQVWGLTGMGWLWVQNGPLSLALLPSGWAETEILGSELTLLEDLPPFGRMHPTVPTLCRDRGECHQVTHPLRTGRPWTPSDVSSVVINENPRPVLWKVLPHLVHGPLNLNAEFLILLFYLISYFASAVLN